jgi:hypothetical protein
MASRCVKAVTSTRPDDPPGRQRCWTRDQNTSPRGSEARISPSVIFHWTLVCSAPVTIRFWLRFGLTRLSASSLPALARHGRFKRRHATPAIVITKLSLWRTPVPRQVRMNTKRRWSSSAKLPRIPILRAASRNSPGSYYRIIGGLAVRPLVAQSGHSRIPTSAKCQRQISLPRGNPAVSRAQLRL